MRTVSTFLISLLTALVLGLPSALAAGTTFASPPDGNGDLQSITATLTGMDNACPGTFNGQLTMVFTAGANAQFNSQQISVYGEILSGADDGACNGFVEPCAPNGLDTNPTWWAIDSNVLATVNGSGMEQVEYYECPQDGSPWPNNGGWDSPLADDLSYTGQTLTAAFSIEMPWQATEGTTYYLELGVNYGAFQNISNASEGYVCIPFTVGSIAACGTPTGTYSPTASPSPTTITSTVTATLSASPTFTLTLVPGTATDTPTISATSTLNPVSATATDTPTISATATLNPVSATATDTPTISATATLNPVSATATDTPTISATATLNPVSATATDTPTISATATLNPVSATATDSPTVSATATLNPVSATATDTPTLTNGAFTPTSETACGLTVYPNFIRSGGSGANIIAQTCVSGIATVNILRQNGRQVLQPISEYLAAAQRINFTWTGNLANGSEAPSGIYYVVFTEAKGRAYIQKVLVVR